MKPEEKHNSKLLVYTCQAKITASGKNKNILLPWKTSKQYLGEWSNLRLHQSLLKSEVSVGSTAAYQRLICINHSFSNHTLFKVRQKPQFYMYPCNCLFTVTSGKCLARAHLHKLWDSRHYLKSWQDVSLKYVRHAYRSKRKGLCHLHCAFFNLQ